MKIVYLEGSYNSYIVVLSIFIAILASYSALTITARITRETGRTRFYWIMAGSFVMGTGVWATHFVGMLAFHLKMTVKYNIGLTLLSMMVSIISSFIAFYLTLPKNIDWIKFAVGGFAMGSGIVIMHYVGMEAMMMSAHISYDPLYWTLSAGIALVASYAAMFLLLRFRTQYGTSWLKWLSACLMGLAICGMHYTGMKAANFTEHAGAVLEPEPVADYMLLLGVTIVIFSIFLVSWGALFFDRYFLEKMAYLDTVTGLPNRNEMNRFFDRHTGEESIGVLFMDLDQFKAVNDTLGHHIGDFLIQQVGERLSKFVHSGLEVFRMGGDEFLITVAPCDQEQAERLAEQVLKSIKKVYSIQGNELFITASIGISISSIHDTDRSVLLKFADTAMYRAKGAGKNRYCVYSEEMGKQELRKMELEKDLHPALDNEQFFLVYQPRWNVKENCLAGWEALIRWNHPRLGIISPGEFIPIAEETGLIVPMTDWTLKKACLQCREWQARGVLEPISVNLSVRLFQTGSLQKTVQRILDEAGLDPQWLELEITESMVLYDIQEIIRQIEGIRNMGVKISMDDFGTGYSSIGLLDMIPLDTLKLDRLFTNNLESPTKRAIISAIILMAENLHLEVIAEGVENQEHVDFLLQLGCRNMQGYFYGRPMSIEQIDEWMKQRSII
ncbi:MULTISPECIES: bifunctional diguanylate cyclase/phosphodiesterase [Paenibacillus]|uniref:Signaling protein n=1 Tax=Paenibacillus vini TaxID=1476024 RepID=A0ABQ4M9I0_9BACL|nr:MULTISPECIES: bifunctional diguanylate cyclase/phosphodiesterase [Paenibacillus]MBQ4899773.1 EAL domain-containing protein [Paenibacillus sp. Marseille-P2973]GIP52648.1 putative signaling protein [Paenibacillus vini]